MAKNLLVINVDLRETRVALIEDGIIAELHVERESTRGTLGNIVLGKVTRVLPGMQAAFIDIGLERAAFLHVEDLIRPDDFEAYLGGSKREDEELYEPSEANGGASQESSALSISPAGPREPVDAGGPEAEAEAHPPRDSEPLIPIARPVAASKPQGSGLDAGEHGEADHDVGTDDEPIASDDDAVADDEPIASDDDAVASDDDAVAEEEEDAGEDHDADAHLEAADEPEDVQPEAEAMVAEPSFASGPVTPAVVPHGPGSDVTVGTTALPTTTAEPSAPAARKVPADAVRVAGAGGRAAGSERDRSEGGERGEKRFRVKRAVRHSRERERDRDRSRPGAQKGHQKGQRNGQRDASRISRSTPIRDVIREGQEVIVQVSKEPIGTKGARVTSHVSLPGRYVVYMPTIDQIGISKRIGSDKERARLREAIESIRPPTGGLIVRTVAEGLTKKQLKADVGYLVRLWAEVAKKREGTRAPTPLYQELDLVLKTARDLFSDDIEQIVIDDREQYQRLVRFVEMFMPERAKDIVYYSGDEPIFDAYGIEDEIGRALSRKVPLPSGGYLIIDEAEALTAIDVNTGRYVGKGSKDLEDTLFKTNMEAVEEIAYQLRFRNLGGLIVLDLIDMDRASNREKVRRRLEELLQKDKAKTTLNRISDLGLIEMTRKRTRESLGRSLHEPCFYCDGTGQLQSKQTIVYDILRQIRRDRAFLPGYCVVVNAHPAVIDVMRGEERESVQEAERRFMRRIELVPRKEYHLEQYDLAGK